MERSVGVTLSAVLVFCGCAAALLAGVLMVLSFQLVQDQTLANPLVRVVLVVEVLVDIGFIAWGVASGIGLLKLQRWARTSMLVFSGIMIAFCTIPMVVIPFIPIPQSEDAPANLGLIVHGGIEVFYGAFVALGILWIYFFNRRSVKAQFAAATTGEIAVAGAPATPTVAAVSPSKRPVLITVIAVLFLVGGCFVPMVLFTHTPLLFFGLAPQGAARIVALIAMGACGIAAGIGLLQLRFWGWAVAVIFQVFNLLNSAYVILAPSATNRFTAAMAAQYAAMGMAQFPGTFPIVTILRISMGFGLVLGVAILWALVAYRKAFRPATAAI